MDHGCLEQELAIMYQLAHRKEKSQMLASEMEAQKMRPQSNVRASH
jgi:hypothetical protein